MSYRIVHFGPGQYDDYLAFVRRYRRDPAFSDPRQRWRVFDNPHGGYQLLGHTDDEIVATLCISGRRLATPAGPLPCFELGDGWTAANHRRRGLFSMMGQKARELAFSQTRVELIIGAPNPQAVPNWRKLQYTFTADDGTALVLLPSPANLVWRRARGEAAGDIRSVRPQEVRRAYWLAGAVITELRPEDYAERTAALPRMNHGGAGYLRWRLLACPDGYRCFSVRTAGDELLCALRPTRLGTLPVLVVSEHFYNGRLDPDPRKFGLLRAIARHYYRNHAGLYINAHLSPSIMKYLHMLRHRFLVHRPQPLCYLFKDGLTPERQALMERLRQVFQLSDCDVG
jgi:hypothetical protein